MPAVPGGGARGDLYATAHVQLPRSVPKGSTRRSNATPRPDGAGPRRAARPVIGRDEEIRRLAQRIVRGDVPEGLTDKRLAAVDMGSLIAGAKYRGEFGRRCWSKPRGRRRGRTGAICSPNFGASRAGAARRRRSWRSPLHADRRLLHAPRREGLPRPRRPVPGGPRQAPRHPAPPPAFARRTVRRRWPRSRGLGRLLRRAFTVK